MPWTRLWRVMAFLFSIDLSLMCLSFCVAGGHSVTRFRDCRVLLRDELTVGDVWVRGGRIIDPMQLFFRERRLPDQVVDCSGLVAAPGFIDLQVNGQNEGGMV